MQRFNTSSPCPWVLPAQVKALLTPTLNKSEKRVARQTFWMGAATGIQLLAGLATVSITARVLGPDGYGVLAVIMSATGLIHGIVSLPGGDAVIAFVSKSVAEGRGDQAAAIVHFALAVSFGMSLLAYAVMFITLNMAREFTGLRDAYVEATLLFGVVGVLGSTQSESIALLRLADRVSLSTVVELAGSAALVGMIVLAWLSGGGLFAIVGAYVVGSIVRGTGIFAAATASAPRAGVAGFLRSPRFRVSREVVRFQAGTWARATIGALNANLDTILVGQLAGAPAAGVYRAARRIVDTCRRPVSLIAIGAQTELSRLWFEGRGTDLRRTLLRVTLVTAGVAGVGFALLALVRGPVVEIVLGKEFSAAASVMLILIPGALIGTIVATYGRMPLAIGRTLPNLLSALVALVISASLLIFLLPSFGAEGAAWSRLAYTLAIMITLAPFAASIIRRSYQL